MTRAEMYAFAMAHFRKPWARRWLKREGYWNFLIKERAAN